MLQEKSMSDFYELYHADCKEKLKELDDNSVDSVVSDPPYELNFMGSDWDSTGIAYDIDMWKEVYRVLKPGGHILAFGGTRTYHRMAVAIEDAGFEIRDSLQWMYGTGFPKSLDMSKEIDRQVDAEREVIGFRQKSGDIKSGSFHGGTENKDVKVTIEYTAPPAEDAKKWDGWGTGIKPAHEPIILARKPISESNIAQNVLEWGTGALNIDRSRIEVGEGGRPKRIIDPKESANGDVYAGRRKAGSGFDGGSKAIGTTDEGRWPANVILDRHMAQKLDDQHGKITKSTGGCGEATKNNSGVTSYGWTREGTWGGMGGYGDEGGISRYFKIIDYHPTDFLPFYYSSKVSRSERNLGVDKNLHPTIKPVELMRYLCGLITPENGVVLDPFAGSGSTGMAAVLEGYYFIGIELKKDHIDIAKKRIEYVINNGDSEILGGKDTISPKQKETMSKFFDIDGG